MKCAYCGKETEGKKVVTSIYDAQWKLLNIFCNPKCMGKAYGKATRIIKKMSREELLQFLDAVKEEE